MQATDLCRVMRVESQIFNTQRGRNMRDILVDDKFLSCKMWHRSQTAQVLPLLNISVHPIVQNQPRPGIRYQPRRCSCKSQTPLPSISFYSANAPSATAPSIPAIAVALAAEPCELDADAGWKDAPVPVVEPLVVAAVEQSQRSASKIPGPAQG